MEYFKKTIILTNENRQLSILSLRKCHNGYFADLKVFDNSLSDCILGIIVGDKDVIKYNIMTTKSKVVEFKLNKEIDLNDNIACMILDKNDYKPLMWGGNGNKITCHTKILEYISLFNSVQKNNVDYVTTKAKPIEKLNICCSDKLDDPIVSIDNEKSDQRVDDGVDYDDVREDVEEVKTTIYGIRDQDDNATDSEVALFESSDEEIEKDIDDAFDNIYGENFYEMIKEQIDELFNTYPSENVLEKLIPNSKWVRVKYDYSNNGYVIGLIYELEVLKYISYGIPANYGDELPATMDAYNQWIPVDTNNPSGSGYYIMFQDAVTGKTIRIE